LRLAVQISRRRAFSLALFASLVAVQASASTGWAGTFAPQAGGSPNADKIRTLWWLIFAVALVVFIGVEGLLFYSLFKFRARKGAVPAQIRGNTRLEIGWTIGAAVILVVLGIFTFALLPGIRNPPNSSPRGFSGEPVQIADSVARLPPNGKSLNICVTGQQYVWRYTYTKNCMQNDFKSIFSYQTMYVPVDTTITLDIFGQDVAHSWWIPQLGGKFDAIPGYINHTWFKIPANMAGHAFTGQCAELCGRNHANMTAKVVALTPTQFEAWMQHQKDAIKAADVLAQAQRKIFAATTP
jgi:cytochrome c oxidase subunit 2